MSSLFIRLFFAWPKILWVGCLRNGFIGILRNAEFLRNLLNSAGIPRNSTEFLALKDSGILRNSAEFHGIPWDFENGIPYPYKGLFSWTGYLCSVDGLYLWIVVFASHLFVWPNQTQPRGWVPIQLFIILQLWFGHSNRCRAKTAIQKYSPKPLHLSII